MTGVRDAVGDDMTLMLDPWGIYTLDESIYVGRELERLGYYFLEHPMHEFRVEPYRRLCNALDIAVCAPEHATWMHYSRAEWVLQGASDIGRIDVNFGGITACKKAVDVYEAFGIPCEMHGRMVRKFRDFGCDNGGDVSLLRARVAAA